MSGIDIDRYLAKSCLEWDLTIAIDYVVPTENGSGVITYFFHRSPNESRYYDKIIGRRTKRIWTQTKIIVCHKVSTPDDTLNFLDMRIPFSHFEEWCFGAGEVCGMRVLDYSGNYTEEWELSVRSEILPKIVRYYERQKNE